MKLFTDDVIEYVENLKKKKKRKKTTGRTDYTQASGYSPNP